jgi:ParB family chromosome partitioning protein
MQKSRLGRGLASLIGEPVLTQDKLPPEGEQRIVPIDQVRGGKLNPRKEFREDELAELAESIRQKGLVQPIVVRPDRAAGVYEIVAGERRWRAAQRAGLHEVPVIVREVDDKEALELAIIENVQRTDLNPIEEAAGYLRLINEFGYAQGDLGTALGKSRSYVANTIRLVNLPPEVQDMVREGKLSAGHARALIPAKDPAAAAHEIVAKGLTVRDAERIAQGEMAASGRVPQKRPRQAHKDPDTRAVERALEDVLGLTVTIAHSGAGGELRIKYKSLDQLDALCRRLKDSAG